MGDWNFFSNYVHVLVCLAKNHEVRLRDVAADVGITERAVQKIVRDLQDAGFVTVSKQGRCNRYRINKRKTLRHSLESHCTVGKFLALVLKSSEATEKVKSEEQVSEIESTPIPEEKAPPARSQVKPAEEKQPAAEKKPLDTLPQGSLF
jgi:Mn-dependent DtxR family transcriptional regulator